MRILRRIGSLLFFYPCTIDQAIDKFPGHNPLQNLGANSATQAI